MQIDSERTLLCRGGANLLVLLDTAGSAFDGWKVAVRAAALLIDIRLVVEINREAIKGSCASTKLAAAVVKRHFCGVRQFLLQSGFDLYPIRGSFLRPHRRVVRLQRRSKRGRQTPFDKQKCPVR